METTNNSAALSAPTLELYNGETIPALGLCTFQGNSEGSTYMPNQALGYYRTAIDIGYRHFDTSFIYNTERELGQAIREKIADGVITREEIFVTTKLWGTEHRTSDVMPALQQSLDIMGLDYVDLFLVHWPVAKKVNKNNMTNNGYMYRFVDDIIEKVNVWQGMEECQLAGLARSIGTSDMKRPALQQLLDNCRIPPAVNQLQVNPFFANEKLVRYCNEKHILVVCTSPLGLPTRTRAKGGPFVSTDPTLQALAVKHNKTPAQIALRFQYQRGMAVLPPSLTPGEQREYLDIFNFRLSRGDMSDIYTCDQGFRVLWLEAWVCSMQATDSRG